MGPHLDDDFRIETHRDDGVVRLAVHGELDLGTSPVLEEAVAKATGAARVELDLSAMSFMDSSGLAVLIGARRRAEDAGHQLAIAGVNDHVRRLLDLTGTTEFILGS
jgi:anti-anti-sigma factor